MLDAAPAALLRVNRGEDTNRFEDLLTFLSNAILKSGKDIFGMRKPSKFNVPGWNERAKEMNARDREAVSQWNIAGSPKSGPLAELKSGARAAFRHEMTNFGERMKINFQNFKGETALISGRKLNHSIR